MKGSGLDLCHRQLRENAANGSSFAVQEAVEQDIKDGLIPFYLMATIGTTSTATVDDVKGLATLCQQHNIW